MAYFSGYLLLSSMFYIHVYVSEHMALQTNLFLHVYLRIRVGIDWQSVIW